MHFLLEFYPPRQTKALGHIFFAKQISKFFHTAILTLEIYILKTTMFKNDSKMVFYTRTLVPGSSPTHRSLHSFGRSVRFQIWLRKLRWWCLLKGGAERAEWSAHSDISPASTSSLHTYTVKSISFACFPPPCASTVCTVFRPPAPLACTSTL